MSAVIFWSVFVICVTAYKVYVHRNSCFHKWKAISYNDIVDKGDKIGGIYHIQCTHCGEITTRKV